LTTPFMGSSLLGMVSIVSLHASLVLHYWAWFVLFHVMPHLFILTGHGVYCFIACLTASFIMGIVGLFHFMLDRSILI
jgi:hypothetical protein